jgi:hypothetical protein
LRQRLKQRQSAAAAAAVVYKVTGQAQGRLYDALASSHSTAPAPEARKKTAAAAAAAAGSVVEQVQGKQHAPATHHVT